MEAIRLPETEDTPEVILDPLNGQFEFRGISIMEDAVEFYSPIKDWIRDYARNPNPETVVNFYMEYCNTSSSKQVYEVLIRFVNIEVIGKKIEINWYYQDFDEDVRD